ncbi:Conserved oligomeric Golgi complex subunit 2 [Gryganskiella cystojenkinii]|nr:Conserved oligomeric Golgi complex subunit 2 [Gryganskiella cystojenkinii]
MSGDLLRKMYKARPPPPPAHWNDDEVDPDEALDTFGTSTSFQDPTPSVHPSKLTGQMYKVSQRYAPLDWKPFFDQKRTVTVPGEEPSEAEITFTVYESLGKTGSPLFVMHHGAGLCAQSFALTAREIKKIVGDEAGVMSYDVRGHGETRSGDEHNMSLDRLARDLKNILTALYGPQLPEIILVGHSMGGAVVAEAASRGMISNVLGVAVLDIVEGVAIETLANMNGWLERRPNGFRSLDKVIQWGVKSGTVRNIESARVSFPPLVVLSAESTPESPCYVWRTDLGATEQYWKGWFTGLTEKFLSSRTAKLLVLAGTDRLDKDMMIGQMQGKFQMLVFPNSGHNVQEDEPERMARELIAFWKRNERLVLPPHPPPVAIPQMVAPAGPAAMTDRNSTTQNGIHPGASGGGANGTTSNAFLQTLNSQLQIAANSQHHHHQGRHQQYSSDQDEVLMSENDFPLSIGVDRAALIALDFDTDEFLSARRHLPLEELKSQLIAHMKELKTELVELINSDYADFINLSTNLNGVDRMMEDLRKPLDRMKGDAIAVKTNLESVVESLEQKLKHRAEIREKKASLQLLLNINESVAKVEGLLQISSGSDAAVSGLREGQESISVAKRLERVAIEYNQMQYLVSKGANLPFVTNIDWRLVRIKETMSENLSTVLRNCIRPATSESDAIADKESLTQCLRTYALIDQTSEAEKVITEDLLAPFLTKTITRQALTEQPHRQQNGAVATPRPLVAMYNKIIAFIHTRCSTLLNVTQKDLKGTNFDIPVNCIWGVTTQTIHRVIPQVFQVADADIFHRNYTDTMEFVSQLEALCGSIRSLTRLRTSAGYQTFMKQWQLQTYFALRFLKISSTIEEALQMDAETFQKPVGIDVHLPASVAVIDAIERCWTSDVYIYSTADHFWKFTLQILGRYSIWVTSNLAPELDQPKDHPSLSRSASPAPGSNGSNGRNVGRSTPQPGGSGSSGGPLRPSEPVGRSSLEKMVLQQLSMVVNDIDHVTARVQEIFETQIQPKLPVSMAEEPVLLESFEQALKSVRQDVPAVQQKITDLITRRCADTLTNNIKNIVARYSDEPPREPSHFVTLILEPLTEYLAGPGAVLKGPSREAWALEVIIATTNRYSSSLAEKLLKTRNLEESASRIKAAGSRFGRAQLPNAFTNQNRLGLSDADKVRLQCVLDVRCYGTELETKFNIETATFEPYLELKLNTQPFENLLTTAPQEL